MLKKLQQLFEKEKPQIKVEIKISGMNGENTAEMIRRLRFELKGNPNQPYTHFILLAGTNDLADVEPDETVDNLHTMLSTSQQYKMKPFILTIPEHGEETKLPWLEKKRKIVNEGIKKICPGSFIDFAKEIPQLTLSESERKRIWNDSIHLNPAGYEMMAQMIFDFIKNRL